MCVCAMSGAHAVCEYVRMGLMYCLNSVVISSLEWPYVVCVSARRTFSRCWALVFVISVCCLNVMPLSIVTPRIFVVGVVGMGVLFRVIWGLTAYSLL